MYNLKKFTLMILVTSTASLAQAKWKTSISCENNSVRLDRYGRLFQLVIDPTEGHREAYLGMKSLIENGAINSDSIRDGKIILPGEWRGATWNYFSYAPRDNGQLVYQIMVSDINKTLDLAVTWRENGISGRTYVPAFTGFKFYGCKNIN